MNSLNNIELVEETVSTGTVSTGTIEDSSSSSLEVLEKIDSINNNFQVSIFCFSLMVGLLVAICFSIGFNSNSK